MKLQFVPIPSQFESMLRTGFKLQVADLYQVVNTAPPANKIVGYYETHSEAQTAAQGHGEWGSQGTFYKKQCMILRGLNGVLLFAVALEDMRVVSESLNVDIHRESALKKLTPEERRALGV